MNDFYAEQRQEQTQNRILVIVGFLGLGFLLVLGRGLQLQLADNKRLEKMAIQQYQAAIRLATLRNRIMDAKGRELAISVPVWSVYADPKLIRNPKETAEKIAKILHLKSKDLLKLFQKPRRFVWVKRRIREEELAAVDLQNFPGIFRLKESQRFYPNGALAAPVLGAVGIDSNALGGVELEYDSYLRVQEKDDVYHRDAKGRLYLSSDDFVSSPKSGDLYLTIDKNLQFIAEDVLENTVQKYKAKGGVIVVMDPTTGAILAMSNSPTFNPNEYQDYSLKHWKNRAVVDLFEPGSIFKPIVAAILLDNKIVNTRDVFDCEGGEYRLPSGVVIHDAKPHDRISFADVLKVSSNIGMYKASQKITPSLLLDRIKKFGFARKMGIDFPGETSGILRDHGRINPVDFATLSFGHGIGVSAVQMLSAFSALGNHGLLLRPYLVSHVNDGEGMSLYRNSTAVMGQAVSSQTAETVTKLLVQAVEEGTGKEANIPGYSVAGKTGTAQKINPETGGYYEDKFLASFIGFVPAQRPRLSVLVFIDDPQEEHLGGRVAAPAFREVVTRSLPYIEMEEGPAPHPVQVVSSPSPVSGSFEEWGGQWKVPSLEGETMREVLKKTENAPVHIRFKGSGFAQRQEPLPGSFIQKGSTVYVYFEPHR